MCKQPAAAYAKGLSKGAGTYHQAKGAFPFFKPASRGGEKVSNPPPEAVNPRPPFVVQFPFLNLCEKLTWLPTFRQ